MQMNFGKEGVSYEMKDGKPIYTDLIMNNPDGLSVGDAMTEWIFANWSGPFAQDDGYIEQYNQYQQQKDALELWGSKLETSCRSKRRLQALKTLFPTWRRVLA